MAYDAALVERIRGLLPRMALRPDEEVGELRMFGGLCFSLNGKMLVGAGKGQLMIRAGGEELEAGLADGRLMPMDFTGKPLRNFAYIAGFANVSDDDLIRWIEVSARYVRENMMGKKKK